MCNVQKHKYAHRIVTVCRRVQRSANVARYPKDVSVCRIANRLLVRRTRLPLFWSMRPDNLVDVVRCTNAKDQVRKFAERECFHTWKSVNSFLLKYCYDENAGGIHFRIALRNCFVLSFCVNAFCFLNAVTPPKNHEDSPEEAHGCLTHGNNFFKHGTNWTSSDFCTTCTCHYGQSMCTSFACTPCLRPVKVTGKCCPHCDDGKTYDNCNCNFFNVRDLKNQFCNDGYFNLHKIILQPYVIRV